MLHGILPDKYLAHVLLLSKAVRLLLGDCISFSDITNLQNSSCCASGSLWKNIMVSCHKTTIPQFVFVNCFHLDWEVLFSGGVLIIMKWTSDTSISNYFAIVKHALMKLG